MYLISRGHRRKCTARARSEQRKDPTSEGARTAQLEQPSSAPTPAARVSDAQLVALQARWNAVLSARLDELLEYLGPRPSITALTHTWHQLADQHRTLRAILDSSETHTEAHSDALAQARDREARMLALTAGLANLDDPPGQAEQRGHALRALIRADHSSKRPVS